MSRPLLTQDEFECARKCGCPQRAWGRTDEERTQETERWAAMSCAEHRTEAERAELVRTSAQLGCGEPVHYNQPRPEALPLTDGPTPHYTTFPEPQPCFGCKKPVPKGRAGLMVDTTGVPQCLSCYENWRRLDETHQAALKAEYAAMKEANRD